MTAAADRVRQAPRRTVELGIHAMPPARGDEGLLRQVYVTGAACARRITKSRHRARVNSSRPGRTS